MTARVRALCAIGLRAHSGPHKVRGVKDKLLRFADRLAKATSLYNCGLDNTARTDTESQYVGAGNLSASKQGSDFDSTGEDYSARVFD
jgi:hypothetical protein